MATVMATGSSKNGAETPELTSDTQSLKVPIDNVGSNGASTSGGLKIPKPHSSTSGVMKIPEPPASTSSQIVESETEIDNPVSSLDSLTARTFLELIVKSCTKEKTVNDLAVAPVPSVVVQPRPMQNAERMMNYLVDLEHDEVEVSLEEKRKKQVARMALKTWKENVQVLEGKVDRRQKQIDGLNFEIYQLVGLFIVFSGVVFTAVTQPNRLERQHIWSPVALCFFAYLVTGVVAINKFRAVAELEKTNHTDWESRKIARFGISELQSRGYVTFNFTDHVPEKIKTVKSSRGYQYLHVGFAVFIVLTVFLCLLCASFFTLFSPRTYLVKIVLICSTFLHFD